MEGKQELPFIDVTSTASPAPPTSYDSLFGRVKAAKDQSNGNVDFCRKFFTILCGTMCCTIMLGFLLAIPIAMIAMGAIHIKDCPAERMIPIYLIVGGSFGIVKNLSSLGQRARNKNDEDADEKNAKTNPFDGILNCFLFAWFIAGNVWIFRTKGKWVEDPISDNYCDPTLYWFAFWLTVSAYIFMGTMFCCLCCTGIVAVICAGKNGGS